MVQWHEEKDVLVIGSGLAGLSAAVEAVQAGASVVVLEKMKVTGGNTRISDGGVAAPNNYLQRRDGIEDSPELFQEDMRRAGLGLNHPRLLDVLARQANEAVEWTRALGVRYRDRLDRFGGHSVARCLTTRSHNGVDFIKAQTKWLEQHGAGIRTRCCLAALLTDDRGAVEGVRIRTGYAFPDENSGAERNIRARRAVVLASGGFGNDVSFRMLQNPGLDASVESTNHRGATAEGLIAALKVHAAPVHLSCIQLGPWGCVDEKGYGRGASFASYTVYPTGILVDPGTGRRIADEWSDRKRRSDAILKTGRFCIGIVDAKSGETDGERLQYCLRQGRVKAFDSLTDLASAHDMPEGRLEAEVDRYNRLIAEGARDEFGKMLGRGANPLDRPPYYAIRLWPKVHHTPGGVGIDEKARVLDVYGRPIPGLFAAGEVCGGVHGASRLGSCALAECLVFGRIAGRGAAGSGS